MKLGELTTRLQTLCHEGWANHEVNIGVLDAWNYKIEGVHKVETGNDDNDTKVTFVIMAEV